MNLNKKYINNQKKEIVDRFKRVDNFYMNMCDTKGKICFYLLDNISINTNSYNFNILQIAKKFNTSKKMVRKSLNTLRKIDGIYVTNHSIKYSSKRLNNLLKSIHQYKKGHDNVE